MRTIKFTKLALLGVAAAIASSCTGGGSGGGSGKGPISFWHNFGGTYTNYMTESMIDPINAEGFDIKAESKGGYDNLLKEIGLTLSNEQYPNIATGYPDHFSKYSRTGYPQSSTGVLANLDQYLNNAELNEAHKAKYGRTILEDYYPEYMIENQTIAYDVNTDQPITVGLPFNKSTEVMGYNGVFFDYVKSLHPEVEVPVTWADWQAYGPTFRSVQVSLISKYLNGDQDAEGRASNFSVTDAKTDRTLLDFSEVKAEESAVLSWDSQANMFITLVRQFGGTFTSYTADDRHADKPVDRHGYMEFWSGDANKAATRNAMNLVLGLHDAGIFATPSTFGSSYSSDAFGKNKVLFTICSTGGLGYNISPNQRFRVAPVPYLNASAKYVISQGANITIFDQGCILEQGKYSAQEMADMSFEAIIKMTTGPLQAKFATMSGYFPASKSATEDPIYRDFINGTPDYSDKLATAYREGAQVNSKEYMDSSKGWTKFVDPGFEGSAAIRSASDKFVNGIITGVAAGGSIDAYFDGVYANADLAKYVRKQSLGD